MVSAREPGTGGRPRATPRVVLLFGILSLFFLWPLPLHPDQVIS